MAHEKLSKQERKNEEAVAPAVGAAATAETAGIKTPGIDEDVDTILDEIDDVLETNAEEFVKSFIQKGGQ